jgi:perosamine synthetase
MPTFTIISCALAAVRCGAVPVVVDADPDTWCMQTEAVAERITPRTRAIMPVHTYGHPVEMQPLLDLARERGLAIIEDAAEAHGAECMVDGEMRRCGSFGDLSTFSFYANKLVTTGEGGMVLTDDEALAARLRSLRNLCFQPRRRFLHEELGHNFRLTNVQAALGVSQVRRMDEIVRRKRAIAARYMSRLGDIPGLRLPVERAWARNVYWVVGLVLEDEVDLTPEELAQGLASRGIETRPFFLGLHEQPALHRLGLFAGEHYPVAERIARRGLYLPSGVGLGDETIDDVCGHVREVLAE